MGRLGAGGRFLGRGGRVLFGLLRWSFWGGLVVAGRMLYEFVVGEELRRGLEVGYVIDVVPGVCVVVCGLVREIWVCGLCSGGISRGRCNLWRFVWC